MCTLHGTRPAPYSLHTLLYHTHCTTLILHHTTPHLPATLVACTALACSTFALYHTAPHSPAPHPACTTQNHTGMHHLSSTVRLHHICLHHTHCMTPACTPPCTIPCSTCPIPHPGPHPAPLLPYATLACATFALHHTCLHHIQPAPHRTTLACTTSSLHHICPAPHLHAGGAYHDIEGAACRLHEGGDHDIVSATHSHVVLNPVAIRVMVRVNQLGYQGVSPRSHLFRSDIGVLRRFVRIYKGHE